MHLPGVSRLNAATLVSSRSVPLVLAAWSLGALCATGAKPENLDWPAYLGGKERNLYSPLKQIDRGNVTQLEVAWTYETGDKGEYQANNLIVDGVLYTASPARQGHCARCRDGPRTVEMGPGDGAVGQGRGAAARSRLLEERDRRSGGSSPGVGGFLFALDAKTGEVIRSFGENGSVQSRLRAEHAGRHLQGRAHPRRCRRRGLRARA